MSDLEFALSLAELADAITLAKFQASDLVVMQKPDLTPVTEADREVEAVIREAISLTFPNDSILGEEFGVTTVTSLRDSATSAQNDEITGAQNDRITDTQNDGLDTKAAARQWIIDPIDGTKNFVRGVPIWATLIALADAGEVVMGVVSAAALGRRWWAAKGQGAWVSTVDAVTSAAGSPRRIRVSGIDDVANASLAYASLGGWNSLGMLDGFLKLADNCWRTRGYGDFYSYMLLAEGAVDIAAEPELEVYDMAALVPIVTEAGGTFTSLDGQPGPWGGNAIATNTHLHQTALSHLRIGTQA